MRMVFIRTTYNPVDNNLSSSLSILHTDGASGTDNAGLLIGN